MCSCKLREKNKERERCGMQEIRDQPQEGEADSRQRIQTKEQQQAKAGSPWDRKGSNKRCDWRVVQDVSRLRCSKKS